MKEHFPEYSIGHFINRPNQPTDFAVLRFDQMDEPDVNEIHKHTFYEILWMEKGRSKQTIDYREYELGANSLFFISPQQVHRFEGWRSLVGGTILFTEEFFLQNRYDRDKLFELSFLDNFYADPGISPGKREFAEWKKTIELIAAENGRKDKSRAIIQSLLHVLLTQVQRCVNRKTGRVIQRKYLLLYKQFKALLEERFMDDLAPSSYAGQLHITPHHLNRVVKDVTGRTASEVIRERSLLEAKRMLTFTDLGVGEISGQLGYFDGSYFTKLFKRETGMAPLAFRRGCPIYTK